MADRVRALDWFTIKYRDIYKVVIGLALLIVLVGGGYWWWKVNGNPQAKADKQISKAQKILDKLDTPGASKDIVAAVQQGRTTLAQARAEYDQRRYKQAERMARDLIDSISQVNPPGPETKIAILVNAEGQVEVKRAGHNLFSGAKENMVLESGDIVKTGKDGYARVKYHNGVYNVVSPDTLMIIQIRANERGGSSINARVEGGELQIETPAELSKNDESKVSTPSAVVSVEPASTARTSHDDQTGQTTVVQVEGRGEIEGPRGQKAVLEVNQSVKVTSETLGTPEAQIPPPVPNTPMNGEIIRVDDPVKHTFVLEWSGTTPTTRVQISARPLFSKLLAGEQATSATRLMVDGLPAGIYYWRVRASGDESKTSWSKTSKFRVLQAYVRPQVERDIKLKVEATPIGDGVILQGETDPGVSVSVNDIEIPVNADGSFNKIVLFQQESPQNLNVRAFDDQGNENVWRKQFRSSSR